MSSDSPDYLKYQEDFKRALSFPQDNSLTVNADGSVLRASISSHNLTLEGVDPNDPKSDLAYNIHSLNFILGRITQSEFANRILKIWPTLPFMDLCELVQKALEEREAFMDEALKRGRERHTK